MFNALDIICFSLSRASCLVKDKKDGSRGLAVGDWGTEKRILNVE